MIKKFTIFSFIIIGVLLVKPAKATIVHVVLTSFNTATYNTQTQQSSDFILVNPFFGGDMTFSISDTAFHVHSNFTVPVVVTTGQNTLQYQSCNFNCGPNNHFWADGFDLNPGSFGTTPKYIAFRFVANNGIYYYAWIKLVIDMSTHTATFLEYAYENSGAAILVCNNGGTAGLNEMSNENSIRYYPNPVSSVLNLKSNQEPISSFRIDDECGKLILEQALTHQNEVSVDLSNLTGGVYFITVYNDGNLSQRRMFIKQ